MAWCVSILFGKAIGEVLAFFVKQPILTSRTQGIYGLEFREHKTPLSDITASSDFGLNDEFQLDLLTGPNSYTSK